MTYTSLLQLLTKIYDLEQANNQLELDNTKLLNEIEEWHESAFEWADTHAQLLDEINELKLEIDNSNDYRQEQYEWLSDYQADTEFKLSLTEDQIEALTLENQYLRDKLEELEFDDNNSVNLRNKLDLYRKKIKQLEDALYNV